MKKALTITLVTLMFLGSRSLVQAHTNPVVNQNGANFRSDNGNETTATSLGSSITGVPANAQRRIRIQLEETAGAARNNMSPRLEFSSNATTCTDGTWTAVTTGTTWRMFNSANYVEPVATTDQIADSGGSFVAGQLLDQTNPGVAFSFAGSDNTEYEWAIEGNGAANSTTYRFRITDGGTAFDAYGTCPTLATEAAPISFTQNSYRWYVDNDGINPTDPWSTSVDIAENTALAPVPVANDPPDSTQELRLRLNITVNNQNLSVSSQQFKLQFKSGTDGSCTTGSWTDVGAAATWEFATSSVTDGADITASLTNTTSGKGEEYVKSSPTQTNHVAANAGEIIEYDFHIIGTNTSEATQYSFRVLESDNTILDAYTNCPTLNTENGISSLLRHGNFFSGSSEQGFWWAD